jgi:hypothetical protein
MATAKKSVSLDFGIDVPSQTRGSRYQELYDLLEANPGQWADVTDAIALLAAQANSKVPSPLASAITLRKHDRVSATTRTIDGGQRVYAAFDAPVEAETEAEE